jgi:predicted dehydrogenase
MSVEPVRVGLVGAGRATRRISLPNLQAIPAVEVVAVCNARMESAQQVAAEFGIGDVVSDWEAMVERNDLDAIWIGTPPLMHAPVAIAALDRGKHVFCQARMARDLAEARMMLAAAERRSDLVAMLSPPPSGMRAGRFFEQLLADGYVGKLRHFQLVVNDDMFADLVAPPHWRQRREVTGLNVLSVAIYAEVIQRWLGSPDRLYARTRVCVP